MNIQKYFETKVGAVNIAPTKISGQYKIVIDTSNNLWLDDYNGRRVKIDKSQSFLEQISRFLNVKTTISNIDNLRYGGFQRSGVKSYHVPFYLGSKDYPNYFVLMNIPTTTLKSTSELYTYSLPLEVKSLKELGLHKLFEEIDNESYFDYPIYFNWDSNSIKMFGLGINQKHPVIHTMNILSMTANQPYFDVFSNRILNEFQKQSIIWPRFINLEFEFDYIGTQDFQNFFGYLSLGTELLTNNDERKFPIVKQYTNFGKISFKHIGPEEDFYRETYKEKIGTCQIVDIREQPLQIRFGVRSIHHTDSFRVFSNNQTVVNYGFDEIHSTSDLYAIESIWKQVSIQIQNLTNNALRFSIERKSNTVFVTVVISSKNDFKFDLPTHYIDVDSNQFVPNEIILNDVQLISNQLSSEVSHILYNDRFYLVKDKFFFNGKQILRLDSKIDIEYATIVEIYRDVPETIIRLEPIDWLTFYPDISSERLYDLESYKLALKDVFETDNKLFEQALNNFQSQDTDNEIQQYVYDDGISRLDKRSIELQAYNENIVKVMMFASTGSTSHLTPYVLNIDKQFYVQNGSIDFNPENHNDYYKYAWFLINGKTFEINHSRYRYCPIIDEPPFTSRLIKISNNVAECIFLGIKYQLPVKYSGFNFYVVLNFNDYRYDTAQYNVTIDNNRKLIRLNINRYLDYNDLIRACDERNEPLIDLSLLYNATDSMDYSSTYNTSLTQCHFYIKPFYNWNESTFKFEQQIQKDWIVESEGKKWFCLQQAPSEDMQSLFDLFPNHKNRIDSIKLYIYNKINSLNYQICSITLKEAILEDNYLWCSDIVLKFFEQDRFFIDDNGELLRIWKTDIIGTPKELNSYMQLVTVQYQSESGDIVTKEFKMLKSSEISFRQEYFDFERTIKTNQDGSKSISTVLNTICNPNEFRYDFEPNKIVNKRDKKQLESSILKVFETKLPETVSPKQSFDLFDVNQVWLYVRSMMQSNTHIRVTSSEQVKKHLTNLGIFDFIQDLSKTNNNLLIENSNEFIRIDVIPVNSNLTIWDSNINKKQEMKIFEINRYNTAYFPLMHSTSEIGFQIQEFSKHNSLWNMFDEKYSNGLGFICDWNELQGNIISTLMVRDDFSVFIQLEKEIDYKQVFKLQVTENQMYAGFSPSNELIANVSKIDKNYKEYILQRYVDIMLLRYYRISDVICDSKQLKFYIENDRLIIDKYEQVLNQVRSNIIQIVFKRK